MNKSTQLAAAKDKPGRTPAVEIRALADDLVAETERTVPASRIVADLIDLNGGEYDPRDEQFLVRSINRARL